MAARGDFDLVERIMLRHFTAVLLDFSGPRKFQGARFRANPGRRSRGIEAVSKALSLERP